MQGVPHEETALIAGAGVLDRQRWTVGLSFDHVVKGSTRPRRHRGHLAAVVHLRRHPTNPVQQIVRAAHSHRQCVRVPGH